MKFKKIDGQEVRVEVLPSDYPLKSQEDCKSNGQYNLGQQIITLFPQSAVLEEFSIPGTRLRIDFFLPRERLAFEFQGEQHSKFSRFFHNSKQAFVSSLKRDDIKRQWCDLNDIKLVYVSDPEIGVGVLKGLIVE